MASKGTPRLEYPYKTSPKDKAKSYELRLAAQFGDARAKGKLQAYNRRIKERRMEANKVDWVIDGKSFNRYKMMDFLVSRIANGESLPSVCESEAMPSMLEVYSWRDNHPEFAVALLRAEEVRGHMLGERALEVALSTDRENVGADKLKYEALSKAAARTNRMFQDKVVNEIKDEYANLTEEQLRDRVNRMIAANPSLVSSIQSTQAGALSAHPSEQETLTLLPEPDLPSQTSDEVHTPDEDEI